MRVDPQFLASVLFSTEGSDTEGWFMNKISRSNRIKQVLSLQVGRPWAKADLLFLKDSLQRGMSLVEIAGFLRRTADEVREKAKDLNRWVSRNRGAAHDVFDRRPFQPRPRYLCWDCGALRGAALTVSASWLRARDNQRCSIARKSAFAGRLVARSAMRRASAARR
jgi:hypothetical protein